MTGREAIRDYLCRLAEVEDDAISIGDAALRIAALDRPNVDLARYDAHLAELSESLPATDTLAERISALRSVIAERHGYAGDTLTYDDDQNASLIRVIDRRKGLPVSLGILFIHTAAAAGWDVEGTSFPYHFLIRLNHGGSRAMIDPFNGGEVVEPAGMRDLLKRFSGDGELRPEFYRGVSRRDVLVRLQNNLKSRAMQARRFERAAEILERMLWFAPMQASLWRELGILQVACGRIRDAVQSAEHYYESADGEAQRHDAALLVQKIRSRLN